MKSRISFKKIITFFLLLFLILFLLTGTGCVNRDKEDSGEDSHTENDEHAGHNHAENDEHAGHNHAENDEHTEQAHTENDEHAEHNHGEDDEHTAHEEEIKAVTVDMNIMEQIGLKTIKIALSSEPVYIEAIGEVIPNENKLITITPIVNGKVKAVNVNLGDYVKINSQLALISSPDLAEAIAELQANSQQIALTGEHLNIIENFAGTGAYSGPPYEEKKKELAQAEKDYIEAKENLKISKAEFEASKAELKEILAISETGEFGKGPLDNAKKEYSEAEKEYLQAENELNKAETELDRAKKLYEAGLISKKELLEAETDCKNARIYEEEEKKQLKLAEDFLEREQALYDKDVRNESKLESTRANYTRYEKEYLQAQAEFDKAGEELEIIKTQMAREENIYFQDLNTREEIHEAESDYREAHIEYNKSVAVLDAFGISPEEACLYAGGHMPVTSPISGYVVEKNVNIGEVVVPETVMFKILDSSILWIDSEIYEKDFSKIRLGQTVEVTTSAYRDKIFKGTIFYISNTFHQETRTFDVRISFDNKEELLKPGMTVNSRIIAEETSGIILPSGTVQDDNGVTIVFLKDQDEDNRFERREVKTVALEGDEYMVISGLSEGDEVVTEGAFQLRAEMDKQSGRGPET